MATSRSLPQFAARFLLISRKVFGNASAAVRRSALVTDQTAVLATPVDKGRARAGWVVGLGSSPPATRSVLVAPGPNAAQTAISQGAAVIEKWDPSQGSIFIVNGVPYIIELENGSSSQAPAGMTAQAIQAGRNELRRGLLLRGL